jgi:MFS family permease
MEACGIALAMVVQPWVGGVSDRVRWRWGRRRPFVLTGTLADLVFLAMIPLAPGYWWLFAAYLGVQVASNTAHGPYQGVIPDLVSDADRGRASGAMGLATLLGAATGSAVVGVEVDLHHVDVAVLSVAVVLLVGAAITLVGIKEVPANTLPPPPPENERPRGLGGVRRDFSSHPDFAWLMLSRFLTLMAFASVTRFAFNYLTDVVHDYDLMHLDFAGRGTATAVLAMVVLAGAALAVVPAGTISDRIGRRALVMIAGAVAATGVVGLLFFGHTYGGVVAAALPLGVGYGMFLSVDWAYATDLIPKGQAGRFMGLSNVATAGASATAVLVGGPVIDIGNRLLPGVGYRMVFVLATLYLVLGIVVLRRVRSDPSRRRSGEQK